MCSHEPILARGSFFLLEEEETRSPHSFTLARRLATLNSTTKGHLPRNGLLISVRFCSLSHGNGPLSFSLSLSLFLSLSLSLSLFLPFSLFLSLMFSFSVAHSRPPSLLPSLSLSLSPPLSHCLPSHPSSYAHTHARVPGLSSKNEKKKTHKKKHIRLL